MKSWMITGVAATLIVVLSVPLYLYRETRRAPYGTDAAVEARATFVGSEKCADCHKREYDLWKDSHHFKAMAVASAKTVLGDFDDAVFEDFGATSRFYRKDNRFYVHTRGPGGEMGEFEITHTFGFHPLQQYLVAFPKGRLQCLPIAWDAIKKRWFHLYPDAPLEPDDWLYWTNQGQNWNGMCAECHSTNLRKNYDMATDSYQTAWSEINVGCEACHGPSSGHVKWAEMPEMGRPASENFALAVKTADMTPAEQIDLCAPCHSRRMSLGDNTHDIGEFMDYGIPQLLNPGMYFADGQILEEVYVYGSFMQSKMYARAVRCSDCHDVHSTRRVKEGNDLCLQCHRKDVYDTGQHHFHKKKGEKGEPIRSAAGDILFDVGTGAQCEQCHMPGRYYMGVDYRPDHSFRLPRPDLSLKMSTPNACARCHIDKTDAWSVETMAKWYGQKQRPHYGLALFEGRKGSPQARDDLIALAGDRLYPAIVRATALSLLRSYSGPEAEQALMRALSDEEALVRYTALGQVRRIGDARPVRLLLPLLYDPVKAVRIEAAREMVLLSAEELDPGQKEKLETVLEEYKTAMAYTADFSPSRHNLGNLYADLGELEEAEKHYLAAIRIDGLFYPAKVNLAMLYNRQGKNDEAERLLREVVDEQPDMHEVQYSLGLLLAERKDYTDAALYLSMAARGLPDRARVHYNLGMLLEYLRKDLEAEAALRKAVEVAPDNLDFLTALTEFYLKRGNFREARPLAERMTAVRPDSPAGARVLEYIDSKTNTE